MGAEVVDSPFEDVVVVTVVAAFEVAASEAAEVTGVASFEVEDEEVQRHSRHGRTTNNR